jgi:cyclomaltodextrinase
VTEPHTPDWVRDAIFYQIFPDRFARSLSVSKPAHLDAWGSPPTPHGYQGGDLLGVAEHLDYLTDLGVNAIYFTPIFQSASNHRYHTHDYLRVDPMLGGDDALRKLIDEAHRREIKIVLDGVFNHASRGFFQFHDILENGENSAYLDWFTVQGFPLNAYDHSKAPGYGAWWNLHALPKFNIHTPAVREFLLGVARHWIDFGIDGWRLDVAGEIEDDNFWRDFRKSVHAGNSDAYIVGEVWTEAGHWLKGDMWDAVMNYLFTRACIAFFIGDEVDEVELARTSFHKVDPTGAPAFLNAINRLIGHYHPNITSVMMNLLSSHDMPRFLSLAKGDQSALRLATLFQMTYPGAPSIYYGDEIGMAGGHDPDNRAAFPWHDKASWDRDVLHDFQRLIALRKAHPALRRGSFSPIHAKDDTFVYLRQHEGETFLIALNSARATRRIDLNLSDFVADGVRLDEVWTKGGVAVEAGQIRNLELAPRSGRVFATTARP